MIVIKKYLISPSLGFGTFFLFYGIISAVKNIADQGLGALGDTILVFLGVGFLSGYTLIRMIWQSWQMILIMDLIACIAVWSLLYAFIYL